MDLTYGSRYDGEWKFQMSVQSEKAANHYIENAKGAPGYSSCPVRHWRLPEYEQLEDIVGWAQQVLMYRGGMGIGRTTLRSLPLGG